jgi:hypothetical protein
MPTTQQINDYWVEPAVVGAALGGASAALWGTNIVVGSSGDYKLWMVMAGLGAASVIVMNAWDNSANPQLPEDANIMSHPLQTIGSIGGTTAALLLGESIVAPGLASENLLPMIAIATGSILGGREVSKWIMGMPWMQSLGSSNGY